MLGGIDENFLKFYKVKFLSGRDLDWKKASDTINGAVINETLAGKLGYNPKTALDKEFFTGWDGKKKYKILTITKRINEHTADYATDYIKIKDLALKEKQLKAIEKWSTEKIKVTYIKINGEYRTCDFTNNWLKK